MSTFTNNYTRAQNALHTHFQLALYKFKDDFASLKKYYAMSNIAIKLDNLGKHKIYNIKYSSLCTFSEDWHSACRGSTFIVVAHKIVEQIFAFNKFFNLHEFPRYMGMTSLEYISNLEEQGFTIVLMDKADGSCIRTWNGSAGVFSTTLGTTSRTNHMQSLDGAPTFWDKSLELVKQMFPEVMAYIENNPGTMLLSELETPWNRIVTYYETECVVPFVIVDKDGCPRWDILRQLAPDLFNTNGYPVDSFITTTDTFETDLAKFFQDIDNNPKFGICPEGAVVYAVKMGDDGLPMIAIPFAKAKRPEYIEKHLNVVLNPGSPKDLMNMQVLFLNDKFDDVDGVGKEVRANHIVAFSKALSEMVVELDEHLPNLIDKISNISSKYGRREFASVVNALPDNLRWFRPYLFKNAVNITIDDSASDLIMNYLKSANGDVLTIQNLQSKNGLMWWVYGTNKPTNKPTNYKDTSKETTYTPINNIPIVSKPNVRDNNNELPFLVLSDFDATLTDQISDDYSLFDRKNIIAYEKPFSILKAYKSMGADMYVLTGRNIDLAPKIEDYVASILGFRVPVLARPIVDSKIVHKTRTVSQLCTNETINYGTVIHLEDDITVLNACSDIVNSLNIRYIGHQLCDGNVADIITTTKFATIVTLVQPPASGKSNTLSKIEEIYSTQGITVTYVSHDRLVQKWRQNNPAQQNPDGSWLRPDGAWMFKSLQKTFNLGVATGGLVIVDMCNDSAGMIKNIKATNSKTIVGTFALVEEFKNSKGKLETKMTEEYKNFCLTNSKNRITARKCGESTLDTSISKANEVINTKIIGCTRQITTRNVIKLATKIVDIDTMVSILRTHIDKALEDGRVTNNVNAYLAVPVTSPESNMNCPDGFYKVVYPHITTVPPTNKLDRFVDKIGSPIECELSEIICVGDTIGQHAPSLDGSNNYHVTRFVKIGKPPSICKKEIDMVTNNGTQKLIEKYTPFRGYQV